MPYAARPGYTAGVSLDDLILGESAIVYLQARTADAVLPELARALAEQTGLAASTISAGLREREALGSTAIGRWLALPHTKAEIPSSRAVVGIAAHGIPFGALDERPVRVFVALVSSLEPSAHLRALAAVSRSFTDPSTLDRILAAEHAAKVLAILRGDP
jgi:mannitol/fructose-specific phosphotransferase system IIA component (Ntr-type)